MSITVTVVMEVYDYPQFSLQAAVCLFTDVTNGPGIRKKIVEAATCQGEEGETLRDAVNFSFVDARLITSVLHLQTAVYYALLAQSQECLRTKTVHSEILWALNPSNNISEAIRRYGISDSTTSLFVVEIGVLPSHQDKIKAIVDGMISPLSQLTGITDWATIKKYHKLNGEAAILRIKDPATANAVIDEIVTSTVAMKSVSQ